MRLRLHPMQHLGQVIKDICVNKLKRGVSRKGEFGLACTHALGWRRFGPELPLSTRRLPRRLRSFRARLDQRLRLFRVMAQCLLLPGRRSAPSPGHEIDIRPRLKERIGRGLDAIHSRDGIKDDLLLFPGVVRSNLLQIDFAERELRTILRPADSGIFNGVAVPRQLYFDTKPNRFLRDPLFDLVEEEV